MLIRQSGGTWHEPETAAYANEKELQDLVKHSPTLLPGGTQLGVVDEFWIPGIGSVDLVGVSETGEIVLVECKLRANPEIRREVIGQTLAYAGGLWRMAYDDFATTFQKRAGMPLVAAVSKASGVPVEEADLRHSVGRRLASGEFTLVVAVDSITPELKLIIEYLNEHTLASVRVLALELSYGRDGEVELLIPTVYGAEAADRKRRSGGETSASWTAQSFAEQIAERTEGEETSFIHRLLEHGGQHGHHPFYGSGASPGMSYYYEVLGEPTSVWALYLKETGSRVALSLGAIAKRSPDAAHALLAAMRSDPALAEEMPPLDAGSLSKYPEIPVAPVLIAPAPQEAFFRALDAIATWKPPQVKLESEPNSG